MSQRTSCVMLSPVLPAPQGSGLEQRAYLLLRELASAYNVTLVVCSAMPERSALPGVAAMVSGVEWVAAKRPPRLARWFAMLCPPLVRFHPEYTSDWPQVHAMPREKLPDSVDVLVCFRMRMHAARSRLFGCERFARTVLDMDDLESRTRRSIASIALCRGRIRRGITLLLSAWQYSVLEQTIAKEYDSVILANEGDAGRLAQYLGSERVAVRSNRVHVGEQPGRTSASHIFTLGFLGTLDYFPNEDAALWLVEDVVPRLRIHLPGPFQIRVAGRGASQRLQNRFASVPEVTFLGEIIDPAEFYSAVDVIVATVRCGGGTKVKVLEAVAFGIPVVATAHAADGLPFVPGKDLLVGTSADGIARHCARLAADPVQAQAVARRAYERICGSCWDAGTLAGSEMSVPSSRR